MKENPAWNARRVDRVRRSGPWQRERGNERAGNTGGPTVTHQAPMVRSSAPLARGVFTPTE